MHLLNEETEPDKNKTERKKKRTNKKEDTRNKSDPRELIEVNPQLLVFLIDGMSSSCPKRLKEKGMIRSRGKEKKGAAKGKER